MKGKKVVRAAIIGEDGIVYSMPKPNRHHNIIHYLESELRHKKPISGKQGFVLSDGTFVDRKTAKLHAIANDQLLPGHSNLDILFSECVW